MKKDTIITIAGIFGIAIIILCRLFQIIWHPEWTESEALLSLAPYYGLSFSLIGFASGWFWSQKDSCS